MKIGDGKFALSFRLTKFKIWLFISGFLSKRKTISFKSCSNYWYYEIILSYTMDKTLRRPIKLKDTSNYEKPYYTLFRRLRKSLQHQWWIQQKYLLVEIGNFLLLLFSLSLLLLLLLLFVLLLLSLLLYSCWRRLIRHRPLSQCFLRANEEKPIKMESTRNKNAELKKPELPAESVMSPSPTVDNALWPLLVLGHQSHQN